MSNAVMALPASGDKTTWTPQESALVEAAGLTRVKNKQTGEKVLADRPTVEAFLQHCRRTGLDPIARQIYAIYRAGKWGIQISIDGARLVAERTGDYEGQTTPEFTADGVTWTQVWLADEPPKAARVGVYRRGFRDALYAVALWDAYAVYNDEWVDGHKTGKQVLSVMWAKMGPLMLAKCCEMLALRKAFPQDLSGLYSTEEMQQADRVSTSQPPVQSTPAVESVPEPPVVATQNWAGRILDVNTVDELRGVYQDAEAAGELGRPLDPQYQRFLDETVKHFGLSVPPAGVAVGGLIQAVKASIQSRPEASGDVVDAEVVEDGEPVTSWPTREPGSGLPEQDPEA